jgi:hypothetical protein
MDQTPDPGGRVEDDLDLDPGTEEEPGSGTSEPEAAPEDPRYKKLQQENRSLRDRLRRSEIEAEHGKEIAELIPASLPMKEWKDYAEKLSALKGPATQDETTQDEAPPVPDQGVRAEREQRLAAVGASRSPGNAPETPLSAKEIQELMQTDPSRGIRAAQAKYGSQTPT